MIDKRIYGQRGSEIEAVAYDDERRVLQITYKLGHVEEFGGVPPEIYYGMSTGQTAPMAVRTKLWGKYPYRPFVPVIERLASTAEQRQQEITETLETQRSAKEETWRKDHEDTQQKLKQASDHQKTLPPSQKRLSVKAAKKLGLITTPSAPSAAGNSPSTTSTAPEEEEEQPPTGSQPEKPLLDNFHKACDFTLNAE